MADPDPEPSPPLRVLMLSWEFPPAPVGGIGRHVQGLSTALAAAGHGVTVLTRAEPGAPAIEILDGVRVLRAAPAGEGTAGTAAWGAGLSRAVTQQALAAIGDHGYDIVHAHDWLLGNAAVALARRLRAPLVSTVHTTEAGRHQRPLPPKVDAAVHGVELRLGHEARRVVVCSRYMRRQVTELLGLAADRVEVIPDGVDPGRWQLPPREISAARLRFGGVGPLLVFAGRLVPEKGVHNLIAALPRLRQLNPGLRAVVAGDGPCRAALRRQARLLHLERAVSFTGFLDQRRLAAIVGAADVLVVPSEYEPAGMVALEAAAAGTPLAVAATGGLTELVEPGRTGATFCPADPQALADAVDGLLAEPTAAGRLAQRARDRVLEGYTWAAVADRTAALYRAVVAERPATYVPSNDRVDIGKLAVL